MNAAVRSSKNRIYNGLKMLGINKGYEGLLNGDIEEMNCAGGRYNSTWWYNSSNS